jgi:hypothetical protein
MKTCVASVLLMLAAQFAGFSADAASYNPIGPQTNVPLSTVTNGGWALCFSETYATNGTSLATVESDCNKSRLMMACRQTGSQTIQLLAQAPRADVLFDTGTSNTPHDANGTGWYFNNNWSWGFAKQGDTIDRDECDVDTSGANDLRLCWHTTNGDNTLAGGYRCGANEGLNGSVDFERLLFQADAGQAQAAVPTLSEWTVGFLALMLAAAGVVVVRRRSR